MNSDTSTWRDRAPRSILDTGLDSRGEPCPTPSDRRWLWRLADSLVAGATNDSQRQLARDLSDYLHETCAHHWLAYPADDVIEAHHQCTWCALVSWDDAPNDQEATR